MDQEADAHGKGARDRNLPGVQQGDNVPAEILGGARRKCGIQIVGHREESADDVIRLEPVCLDQGAQQLIGGCENLVRVVARHGGGATDPVKPDWESHGR